MNSGKVPVNVLKRSVLRQLKNKRTEIANSAGLGADCAVFAPFSEGQMVTCVQEGVVELQCENDLAEAEREDLSVMPCVVFSKSVQTIWQRPVQSPWQRNW